MRQLLLAGPFDLRVQEVPSPTPAAGQVLLRVEAAGVCGSDLHGYRGLNDRRRPGTVMGHEVSGTVELVGPGVDPHWAGRAVTVNPILGCGMCVACRAGEPQRCPDKTLIGCTPTHPGGFAESLVAPVTALVPWPGPAPLAWGPLAEPLAVGRQAVPAAAVRDARVLVIGSGPVAIGAALSAGGAAASVTMTEGGPGRTSLLRRLGLSVADAAGVATSPPFDVVVDCVATEESLDLALTQLRIGGTAVVVGLGAARAEVSVERLVQLDLVLRGSAQYSQRSYADVVRWLASGPLDLTDLLASQPLSTGPALFSEWEDDQDRPVRILLTPT